MNTEKIIVSLTSYPKRIGTVIQALETVYAQTRPADEVVLWLAEDQFPDREAELPEELRQLMRDGKLTVRWCDDLKSHKKYFYALQEYSDSLVVTVDDDLRYGENMLEDLYQCYLRHPGAVSTVRAHLMILTEGGKLMPYRDWIQETDVRLDTPSMQLFATGGAGTLYPPNIFRKELFDKEAVLTTCLYADDLWLKTMALLSDVPVVVAQEFQELRYVPGSQEEALYHQNVDNHQNDVQMERIVAWAEERYGSGILTKKLNDSGIGTDLRGIEEMCLHLRRERSVKKAKIREQGAKLKQTYGEKSEINAKLKQTYGEKSEINAKLKQTYAEKNEINAKLKQTYAEKNEINAKLKQTSTERRNYYVKLKNAYSDKSALAAKLNQTYAEKSELNAKLQRTYAEKSELNKALKEARARIQELENRGLMDRIFNRKPK